MLLLSACSPSGRQETRAPAPDEKPVRLVHQASGARAELTLSGTNLPVSATWDISLEVETPSNLPVNILPLPLPEPFLLTESYLEPHPETVSNRVIHHVEWSVFPGPPGEYKLPPIPYLLGSQTQLLPAVSVRVYSVLPPEESLQLRGMAPLEPYTEAERIRLRFLLRLLKTAAIISGLILLFWLIRRLSRRPRTPEEEARFLLEKADGTPVEQLHRFHRILLHYMTRRWNLENLDSCDIPELLNLLRRAGEEQQADRLEPFLEKLQTVRFSHRVPPGFPAEAKQFILRFVEETSKEQEEN
jgi:hypothetical protein